MYKTCTQIVNVEIDQPYGKEDCMWVSGRVEFEVSVTRDFGHYGGRSDDYPGDPDEITIEKVFSYELWISDSPGEHEGTCFKSGEDGDMLCNEFLMGLGPCTSELEVDYDED